MKDIELAELSSNVQQVDKIAKPILREAVFDEAIHVFFNVPEGCVVWEYDPVVAVEANAFYFGIEVLQKSNGVEVKNIKGLMLDPMDLVCLIKKGEVFVESFSTGVVCSENKGEVEIISPKGEDFMDILSEPWRYYVFHGGKTDETFCPRELLPVGLSMKNLSVAIDITKVKESAIMRDLIPQSFFLPEEIQQTLSQSPTDIVALPPRLKIMWDAYLDIWKKKVTPDFRLNKDEIKAINEKVIQLLVKEFGKEERIVGRPLGDDFATVVSKMLIPDYLDGANKGVEKSVSLGIPSLFWIVNCFAELVTNKEFKGELPGFDEEEFSRVLYALNRPEEMKHLSFAEKEYFELLKLRFPEIAYLRFARFSKPLAKKVAKLFD